MKHESSLYDISGLEEWLVYCSISSKTFSISFVGDSHTYSAKGTYLFSGLRDLTFNLTGLGKAIDVTLQPDKTGPWIRRLFGTAPYIGALQMDASEVGSCEINNSHSQDDPVVRLKSKSSSIALEVYRSRPNLVRCPLLVCGSDYWQAVLEDYLMMSSNRQERLPKVQKPHDFVGSFRITRYSQQPFGGELEAAGAIVAMTELLVKPEYMAIEAT